jgi:hypothetical protein
VRRPHGGCGALPLLSALWAAYSATAQAWSPGDPIGPQFSEAQKATQRSAGTNILSQIRTAAANHQAAFTIPVGDYRFSANKGVYPTLSGLRDMAIAATGATFWFDPPDIWGLQFLNSTNVQVNGLTLDYDPPPFAQGQVTAINSTNSTVDVQVMSGYPMPTNETRAIIFYHSDGSFILRGYTPGTITVLGGQGIRVQVDLAGVSVGDYLVAPIRTGVALQVNNCGGMLFQDVNIWASGGMALKEQDGGGGNVYRRVTATRRPATNRLHAFGADGFHMSSTRVGPTVDECEIAYTSDDIINVHGYFGWVSSRTNGRHFRVLGTFFPYSAGQQIQFWDNPNITPAGTAVITQVTQVTDTNQVAAAKVGMPAGWTADVFDLVLDTDVAAKVTDLVEHNAKACQGFAVKNCYFHDCFQRAFLLGGSPGGTILSNTFERIYSGISVHMETWMYMEGPFGSNLSIVSNRLVQVPEIWVSMAPTYPGPHRYTPITNVSIGNNYIEGSIQVLHVAGLEILSNTLAMTMPVNWTRPVVSEDVYGKSFGDAIYVSAARDVNIAGNTVTWSNSGGSNVRLGGLTANARIDGALQWDCIADGNTGWFINGSQGDAGWYYGVADGAAVRSGQYQTNLFQQLPVFNGYWHDAAINLVPFIDRFNLCPSSLSAIVRRWVAPANARLRAQGRVQTADPSGDQTVTYLFAGGRQKWSCDNTGNQVNSFDVDLGEVDAGTPVDFVLDSKGWGDYDTSSLSVRILQAPTPPTLTNLALLGTNLVLSGADGVANANCYLLASTNAALPLAAWTRLATNSFASNGTLAFTNSVGSTTTLFFRLMLP